MDEQDDVKIEADDLEAEEKAEDRVAKLRGELSAVRRESREYMDGWQRAKADYVNAQKRFGEDTKTAELRGKLKAVEVLLPAFDALERAKDHGEIPEGFLAIARQLETAFSALGLSEVGTVGEQFDTSLHESLGQDAVESEQQDDTVTAILEKGWRIGETIIRPAKVRVAHFTNGK